VLCCAVLCCAVLCCAVLCCAVLCCAVLCCAVLCRAVPCCSVPQALHTHAEYQLADTMVRFWINFARTGDPNRNGNGGSGADKAAFFAPVSYLVYQVRSFAKTGSGQT
jgi:hypothetical protein